MCVVVLIWVVSEQLCVFSTHSQNSDTRCQQRLRACNKGLGMPARYANCTTASFEAQRETCDDVDLWYRIGQEERISHIRDMRPLL